MVTISTFLFIYILGGLTFIPLLLAAILCHAYLTLPTRKSEPSADISNTSSPTRRENHDGAFKSELDSLPDELKPRAHEPDVAAGYFAVCREYVPGGVNGKPPERTTPAGAVVGAESPSVYQSMYRSIFDRNKTQGPTLDGGSGKAKRARNVFFVILRHGHLMLYDDSEQLEVRHVISLAHYDVDLYAGGENIPDGELFIKRNCIRLSRKRVLGDITSDMKPFFLFSDNCSEKEDFYLAMLQSQEQRAGASGSPPTPLLFETDHLVKLVQQLHASEENLQTRWINALIGRLFLGLYKTSEVEDFIRLKITKKISRVRKPAFISSINLQKVNMGDLPPFITNPKLKELTVDGDLTVEADVKYKGNFRLEIAAVARIDLGSRFKAREVNLILAGILKRLEGHILIRVKPPPSNRLWISFETAPKMVMSIEPIVSSRQITYGVILRAIESRIREVLGETLVFPNWDDVPFHDTMLQRFRGGIWADDLKINPIPDSQAEVDGKDLVDEVDHVSDSDGPEPLPTPNLSSKDKAMSMPSLTDTRPAGLTSGKATRSTLSLDANDEDVVASSKVEMKRPTKPKAIRSGSFASASTPIVNLDPATVEALKVQARNNQQDAASAMKSLSSRSQPTSPVESPVGSPSPPNPGAHASKNGSRSSTTSSQTSGDDNQSSFIPRPSMLPQLSSLNRHPTLTSSSGDSNFIPIANSAHAKTGRTPERRQAINNSLNSATAAAKKWFAGRQQGSVSSFAASQDHDQHQQGLSAPGSASTYSLSSSSSQVSTSLPKPLGSSRKSAETVAPISHPTPRQPIGRGRPLPPPGTPLPLPPKSEKRNSGWSAAGASALANLAKRKPSTTHKPSPNSTKCGTPALSEPPSPPKQEASNLDGPSVESPALLSRQSSSPRPVPLPPLPPRRKRLSNAEMGKHTINTDENILVVEAPVADVSAPTSPTEESIFGEQTGHSDVEDQHQWPDMETEDGDDSVFQEMDMDARQELCDTRTNKSKTGLGDVGTQHEGMYEHGWSVTDETFRRAAETTE
ncbi:hypothetical protein K432DRAFT_322867 [Lepidopterella palustris CBS 459.81]|uniref:SMP-LTD domain-containing protein n=1 Tax=Lepidopterella palustris CBS 459.81 TaxID=1314670 RepID=A0A8E2EG17_9PEZI|nr:hypothetical protein K432DRAFT_322867 [Lepidopterella palustris CBS 459.81]